MKKVLIFILMLMFSFPCFSREIITGTEIVIDGEKKTMLTKEGLDILNEELRRLDKKSGFVDRGDDPTSEDFFDSDLTINGGFHDLDISSIVPPTAKAVLIRVTAANDTVGSYILLKSKHENGHGYNAFVGTILVADEDHTWDAIVPIEIPSQITYKVTLGASTWDYIALHIGGWWL